ncbi:hypothetical protein JCM18901_1678 [Psychrobacter sp. JCM 18901]|nr:hypothetical protein JCM18901_1678 [Psychrobacter sp. JCM 18901]
MLRCPLWQSQLRKSSAIDTRWMLILIKEKGVNIRLGYFYRINIFIKTSLLAMK